MNARRTRRPVSVAIGTFCRFGFEDDSRPVTTTAWLKWVCTRPVSGFTSAGSASTYVPSSLASSRCSSTSGHDGVLVAQRFQPVGAG